MSSQEQAEQILQDDILRKPDEELLALTEADILPDGSFGQRWLAITNQRLMTFSPNGHGLGEPDLDIPLDSIQRPEPAPTVGRMALIIHQHDGTRIEAVHYTNALAESFGRIMRGLGEACAKKEVPVFDKVVEDERRCGECGRLLPEKGSFCPACLKKHQVLARFWKYMRPHWHLGALVICCILGSTAATLVPPLLIMVLVDDVLKPGMMGQGDPTALLFIICALVGSYFLMVCLSICQNRLSVPLSANIMHEVRVDFFEAVQRLSLQRHDKTQTGSLLSRVGSDTQMLQFFFIDLAIGILPQTLLMVGICVMLFILNWHLALLVMLPTPIIIGMAYWFHKRIRGRFARMWQRRAKMTARANDSISGIRVVKAFARESTEVTQFRERSEELRSAHIYAESFVMTYFPTVNFVIMSGTFLVWYFGGLGVMGRGGAFWDGITLGTLMAYLAFVTMFYGPLQMMARISDYINRAMTAAQRLFEIADADQEIYDAPDAVALDNPKGEFRFENVHFSYTKDAPVLKGMDVEIQPGEMIGLVGRSGVGKTTMINLICRFYEVDEGTISLDGVDVRNIKLRDLRRQIGIVPQEPYLFNASIAENIRYGNPEATLENVMQAAMAANAHGFILRQPDGYDTPVGERGARLSGGERQRLAIARAILHDPKVLILDEATSSVDTETEELIQQALMRLVKGRTTFAIAHRLSTLRNADRLLVIEDGKVAEFGTHEELLKNKGLYHRLVTLQSKLSSLQAVGG